MGQSHAPLRKRMTGTPSLAQFTVLECLCFSAGWRPHQPWDPPGVNEWRWSDWTAFLRDWTAIRDQFIARYGERRPDGSALFGDLAATYARQYGLAGLTHASGYAIRGELEPEDGEPSG